MGRYHDGNIIAYTCTTDAAGAWTRSCGCAERQQRADIMAQAGSGAGKREIQRILQKSQRRLIHET